MTTDPISAVLEGVLLGSEELGGRHPWKATAEDIINACAHLVDEYGIKLERQGKACSDLKFTLGGDDTFVCSQVEDDEGNPAILIELDIASATRPGAESEPEPLAEDQRKNGPQKRWQSGCTEANDDPGQ